MSPENCEVPLAARLARLPERDGLLNRCCASATSSSTAPGAREIRKAEALARAAELLELVGIDKRRVRSYPHELSGGMRQRVVIRDGAGLRPELIVMDEPTTVTRRRRPARDPAGDRGAEERARVRRPLHHPRPVRCSSRSATGSGSCTPVRSSSRRRRRSSSASRSIRTRRADELLPPLVGEIKRMTAFPASRPTRRPAIRAAAPPALPHCTGDDQRLYQLQTTDGPCCARSRRTTSSPATST